MAKSQSGFNRRSTTEQVTEGIDLSGKTILITGVNSGLGYESMRVLAMRGAHVIGAARTLEKAQAACDSIEGRTTPIACELGDPASVVACAREIISQFEVIDVLMANAGIMSPADLSLINDYASPLEAQFATNHMGHFVLIHHLLPLLKRATQGRIVLLSSMGHVQSPKGGIDFDNLDCHQGYNPWETYGQSKLANILCARHLNTLLADTAVTANAVHPGVIKTNLSRNSAGLMFRVIQFFANFVERTVPQGAATQCYVATHPSLATTGGEYFADCNIKQPSDYALDDALASRLWDESVILAAAYLDG